MKIFYVIPESGLDFEGFIYRVNDRIKNNEIGAIFEPLTFKTLRCFNGINIYVVALKTNLPNIIPNFFFRFIIKKALKKEFVDAKFYREHKALKLFITGGAV